MNTRALIVAALVFAAGGVTGAATVLACGGSPRMSAKVLLDVTTGDLRYDRTRVRVHLDSWEPDSEAGQHRHPGPTLIYVLEGQLEETSPDGVRTLRPGQAVWNHAGTTHNVRNRGHGMARALAVHLDPAR